MSYIKADRVKESSTIVGTGTISLLGSAVGFRTFASQMSVGDTCSYVIANTTGSEWEVGIATYSAANTLTRTTVQSSTNANAVVNFSAGMKDVFISPTAQSVIDYNPITHQISNADSIVASSVASGVGNSLTITAGNGVGVGAGGNIILAPGSQGSSGGNGKVIINNDANINQLTIGKGIGQGYDSTAFGVEALNTSSLGLSNTALGYHTLKNTNGAANTAIGSYALEFNNDGYYGTAIGAYALYVNTDGSQNTAVGAECLGSVTTGNNNVAIGAQAGANLVNGSNNILIGKTVYSPATSTSNFMTIGNLIFASGGFGTYNDIGTGNVGIGQASPTAKLHVKGSSSSTKGVIVQGASSQTANLQEWQNSAGTALAYVNASGTLYDNAVSALPVASGVGNNLTLTAGSGVGTGAGGSLVLQAGVQATSGGDGKVVVKQISGQTSNLQEWQNSASAALAYVNTSGYVYANSFYCLTNSYGLDGNSSLYFRVSVSGAIVIAWNANEFNFRGTQSIGWTSGSSAATSPDLLLYRDAADTLAQRRSTNPQTFRVYNTYTDASNYERYSIGWSSNICTIGLAQAGTGSTRNLVVAGANATSGAGGNVTITGGNGSGVGAGGNIILQPGAQGTSGGNGNVVVSGQIGVSSGANAVGASLDIWNGNYTGNPPILIGGDVGATGARTNNTRKLGAVCSKHYTNSSSPVTIISTDIDVTNNILWLGGGFTGYNAATVINFATASTTTTTVGTTRLSIGNTGYLTVSGSFNFPSTTTAFSANTNDLALTASAFQRINCTVASSLTGIAPPTGGTHVDGRMIRIYNVGAENLTLSHNNASSTAANRFFNSTGADIILATHQYVELIYDSTDNGRGGAGWRVSSIH